MVVRRLQIVALDSADVVSAFMVRYPVNARCKKVIVGSGTSHPFHISYREARFGLAVVDMPFIDSHADSIASAQRFYSLVFLRLGTTPALELAQNLPPFESCRTVFQPRN